MKKPLKTCTPTHPERYGTLSAPSSNTYAFSADGLRKARYSVKWKSSEGKLVLKITDDVTVRICPFLTNVLIPLWGRTIVHCVETCMQCLKFKTHSSIFLGRFEALNRSLIQKMMNTRPPPPPAAAAAQVVPATISTSQPQAAAGSKSSSTPTASTGGGVKKKKGKKK
jgi:signal recognition particle subunit SRP9